MEAKEMASSYELRKGLDERGIEHEDVDINWDVPGVRKTMWENGGNRPARYEEWRNGTTRLDAGNVTPARAIAATAGATEPEPNPCRTPAELSKKLREAHGLHDFSELFGFDWQDDSDWTWHDVACAMADAIEVATADTYSREDVECSFVSGYSLGTLPVGSDPQWDENRQTVDEHMEELGWVRKDAATAVSGYGIQFADFSYPSEPRKVGKVPDEVLFVNDDGSGVTHFTTEKAKATKVTRSDDGIVGRCTCSECGESVHRRDLYCWHCGSSFE